MRNFLKAAWKAAKNETGAANWRFLTGVGLAVGFITLLVLALTGVIGWGGGSAPSTTTEATPVIR